MFLKTLHRFRALPETTRAMVFLYWVYEFSQTIVGLFLNVFVFLETRSLLSLILYNFVFAFFIMLGFSGWGALMARWQISLKYNYLRAFTLYIFSFFCLIFLPREFAYFLLFAALNGLGLGMFWVGVHGYEMLTTNNKNRDFYSSMVTLGSQIISILSPLVATVSFTLSEKVFHLETFEILLWILPFIYLSSLPFLFKLPHYTPPRIPKQEWKRLFFDKKLRPMREYIVAGGLPWGFHSTLYAALSILSLKTVINLGLFQTAAGLFSVLLILFLSHKRHEGNRVKILFHAVLGLMLSAGVLLFWQVSPLVFIGVSLAMIVLKPIYRVSEHVIDLQVMEKLTGEHSFYPGIVYRDIIIWIGRALAISLLLLFSLLTSEVHTLQLGLLALMLSYAMMYLRARKL